MSASAWRMASLMFDGGHPSPMLIDEIDVLDAAVWE
jgi:hypothetical protein